MAELCGGNRSLCVPGLGQVENPVEWSHRQLRMTWFMTCML